MPNPYFFQSGASSDFDSLAPTTTEGDLINRSATTNQRLAIGTNTQVLTVDTSVSGKMKWAAQGSVAYRSVTTTDAPTTSDDILALSGASFTITLPTAVGNTGKKFKLLHLGTSLTQVFTIATTSAQTVGGIASGSYALYTNGEILEIVSDGANWQIIDHKTDTDWTNAGVITITATTSNPSKGATTLDRVKWRRNGTDAIINYAYVQSGTSGAAGTGDYLFGLPTNLTIDTALVSGYTTVLGNGVQWKPSNVVGFGMGSGNTDAGHYAVSVYDSTKVRAFFVSSSSISVVCAASNQNTNIANVTYNWEFRVPIANWRP